MTPLTANTPFENSFLELTGDEYARRDREVAAPHEVSGDRAAFILAGKAFFTLRSVKTGARFTYRVALAKEDESGTRRASGPTWFVSLLNGPDNWQNYMYLGVIGANRQFRLTAKSRASAEASSVRAFAWTWARLSAGQPIEGVEIWHEGKCGRCGRKLTVPESIETGLGPECATKGME